MNAVEREPVPTRVLNPNASEASHKLKQRSYRKMKLNFLKFYFGYFGREDFVGGGFYPGTPHIASLQHFEFLISVIQIPFIIQFIHYVLKDFKHLLIFLVTSNLSENFPI